MALLGAEKGFQVDGLTAALQQRAQVSRTNSVIEDYNQLAEKYQKIMMRMLLSAAEAEARLAQFELLEKEAPDAPCLKPTPFKYSSGKSKTVARLHFEEVLRSAARKLGVPDRMIDTYLGL